MLCLGTSSSILLFGIWNDRLKFTFGWYQGWIWRVDDRYWLLAMNIILISLYNWSYILLRRRFKVDLWNRPKAWWPTFLRWHPGRGYPRDLDLKPHLAWNKPIDRWFLQAFIGYAMCCVVLVLRIVVLLTDYSWIAISSFKTWSNTVTTPSDLIRQSWIQYCLWIDKIHHRITCSSCISICHRWPWRTAKLLDEVQ